MISHPSFVLPWQDLRAYLMSKCYCDFFGANVLYIVTCLLSPSPFRIWVWTALDGSLRYHKSVCTEQLTIRTREHTQSEVQAYLHAQISVCCCLNSPCIHACQQPCQAMHFLPLFCRRAVIGSKFAKTTNDDFNVGAHL